MEPSTLNVADLAGKTERSRKKAVLTLSLITTDFQKLIKVLVQPEIMPNPTLFRHQERSRIELSQKRLNYCWAPNISTRL